jgi:hypothetical protein
LSAAKGDPLGSNADLSLTNGHLSLSKANLLTTNQHLSLANDDWMRSKDN